MTDSREVCSAAELPRRLTGETKFPEPATPLRFETRPDVLKRVRDGLVACVPPEVPEHSSGPSAGFH